MPKRNLQKPPLVEAIFEVRWDISKVPPEIKKDNKILAGILLNKIQDKYPHYEALEISNSPIPEDMIAGIVQHRFRAIEKGSPLIQIGAGVFTTNYINEGISKPYDWEVFKNTIVENFSVFNEMYPLGDTVESVSLKYINALDFDFEKNNISTFLKEKMDIDISLPIVTEEDGLPSKPSNFNFTFAYPSTNPSGILKVLFGTGKKAKGNDALVWHIDFISKDLKAPKLPDELDAWLESSHDHIDKTFFKLIKNLNDIIN